MRWRSEGHNVNHAFPGFTIYQNHIYRTLLLIPSLGIQMFFMMKCCVRHAEVFSSLKSTVSFLSNALNY